MKLYAKDGYMLTNGEVYGKIIDLGSKDSKENYYEITIEEYEELTKIDDETDVHNVKR